MKDPFLSSNPFCQALELHVLRVGCEFAHPSVNLGVFQLPLVYCEFTSFFIR